jgi:hypothetical protein
MILDIVRQAVQFKIKSQTESPLISEAEYCCACGEALRLLGDPNGLLEEVRKFSTVEAVRETICGLMKEALEKEEDPGKKRLFHLLIHSRATGTITEEIRVLFDQE